MQYAGIDWTGFIGLRDVIAHDYYNLNPVKIFEICVNETVPLRRTAVFYMATGHTVMGRQGRKLSVCVKLRCPERRGQPRQKHGN